MASESSNPIAPPEKNDGQAWLSGPYGVLGMLCLCAAIAYIQRAAISVPAPEIADRLGFTDLARQMGWVQSSWYLAYGLMQLPSGWLADRYGSRRMLACFAVLWSLATLVTAAASGYHSLWILWGLMGAAQAGAFPCAAKAIGQIFPESRRARATGLLAFGMAVGGAAAPITTAALLELLWPLSQQLQVDRWRLVLAAYSIPGLLWAGAFLWWVPRHHLTDQTTRLAPAQQRLTWSKLLTDWSVILLCAQQFFRAAGMVFFLTWFPTFLQKTRGVSITESGILTTLAGAGAALGSLTGGFFSDWLFGVTGNARLSRQGIAIVGMSTCAILIVISSFVADLRSSIALIGLGAFCATFGGVSGYTVAINYGGRYVATVFSTMNMCGNMGAALFPVLAGWLVSATGNWNLILFSFAAIMAVDAICWAILNPRGTIDEKLELPENTSLPLSGGQSGS
jgi:MFS family permease